MRSGPLLIIGASCRAAAESALRAGYEPHCLDQFADRDLAARAPVSAIPPDGFPAQIPELLASLPSAPWMFAGGLENHPDTIERITASRPLIGSSAEAVRKVRDPWAWTMALARAGLPHAEIRRWNEHTTGRRWLAKPLRSAGGIGIRWAEHEQSNPASFLQEFIDGEPQSAVYIAEPGRTRLIGVSRQLVGCDWLHAGRFLYCGNVGPLPADPAWERLGQVIAEFGQLRGTFGIDAIVNDRGIWPVEINPRYSASVELYEWTLGSRVLAGEIGDGRGALPRLGKAIYYAPRDFIFPQAGIWDLDLDRPMTTPPRFADIPWPGSMIARGQPVLTLFGRDEAELRERAAECDRVFR